MLSRASGDDGSFIGKGSPRSTATGVEAREREDDDDLRVDATAGSRAAESREGQRAPRRHQFRFTLEDGSYADVEPDRVKRNLKMAIIALAVVAVGVLLVVRYLQRPALSTVPGAKPTLTSNYVAPSEERSREQAVSVQASATAASASAEAPTPDAPAKALASAIPEPTPKAAASPASPAKTPAAPAAPTAKAAAAATPAKAPAATPAKGSDNPYSDTPKPLAGGNTDNPY